MGHLEVVQCLMRGGPGESSEEAEKSVYRDGKDGKDVPDKRLGKIVPYELLTAMSLWQISTVRTI